MSKRLLWLFAVMVPIGGMAGFLVAAAVTWVMPTTYESVAKIELIAPMANLVSETAERQRDGEAPAWVRTEIAKMNCQEVLDRVIERLHLQRSWGLGKDPTLRMLHQAVTIQSIRGTVLVIVRARHPDPVTARDIAAEILKGYQACEERVLERELAQQLRKLTRAIQEQEEKVTEMQHALELADRTRLKNIHEPGFSTLLHIPDEPEYLNARMTLDCESHLLQQMKEALLLDTPTDSPSWAARVVIHDDPLIPHSPASPNVALNLALGAVLGMLTSAGLGFAAWRSSQTGHSAPTG